MIGEETARTYSMLQREAIELLFKLLFKLIDREKSRHQIASQTKEKKPQVKIGELSEKTYNGLLKQGEKFRMIDVPADKLDEIKSYASMVGATYHAFKSDDKTAMVAVSEKAFQQFEDAIKQVTKAQLSGNKDTVMVMKDENLIPAEQVKLAKDTLYAYDIPVFSFSDKDGRCMNIVPKEYIGQYKAAMTEVSEAMKSVQSVKIADFDTAEKAIADMEQIGEAPIRFNEVVPSEETLIIYDEQKEKYIITAPDIEQNATIEKKLADMGYSEIQTAAIMSKLSSVCTRENIGYSEEKTNEKSFDSNNAELSNIRYSINDGSLAIIKADVDTNGEPTYKYITANQGASRGEIEAAIRKGIAEDEKTVTDIMQCLDSEKAIPVPEQIVIPSLGYKVSLVTSSTYEISKDGVSLAAQKGKPDIAKVVEKFAIDEKQAGRLISKVEKAINSISAKPTFLSQLKQATAKADKGNDKDQIDKNISTSSESRSH